jgi:hypothetical protein
MAEFTTSEKFITICISMSRNPVLTQRYSGIWQMRYAAPVSVKETGFIIHYLEKRVNLIYEFLHFIPLCVFLLAAAKQKRVCY